MRKTLEQNEGFALDMGQGHLAKTPAQIPPTSSLSQASEPMRFPSLLLTYHLSKPSKQGWMWAGTLPLLAQYVNYRANRNGAINVYVSHYCRDLKRLIYPSLPHSLPRQFEENVLQRRFAATDLPQIATLYPV